MLRETMQIISTKLFTGIQRLPLTPSGTRQKFVILINLLLELSLYLLPIFFLLKRSIANSIYEWIFGFYIISLALKKRFPRFDSQITWPVIVLLLTILSTNLVTIGLENTLSEGKRFIYGICLFFILVDKIGENRIILKRFVLLMLSLSVIVSMDTLLQLHHGSDLLGRTYKGGRLTAVFAHPNYLGFFLAGIVPIHIYSIQRNKKFWVKILLSVLLLLCLLSIGFSGTRSAWVAVFLLLLFYYIYDAGNKFRIIYLIIPALIIPMLYLKSHDIVRSRFYQTVNIMESNRVVIWKNTLAVIKDTPLLGTGLDTFRKIDNIVIDARKKKRKEKLMHYSAPHFFPFEIWQTSGIIALFAFLFFLYRIVVVNIKYIRERREFVFLFLSWVMVFLTSVINIPFFSRYVSFYLWFFLGLLLGAVEFQRREVRQDVQ